MSKIILLKHSHSNNPDITEVGVDEAGRGALAGPVTVAACIMPYGFQHELIKDSKILKEDERVAARQLVLDNCIAYSIQHIDVDQIENTNILKATLEGMRRCLEDIKDNLIDFDFILVDGDQFHGFDGIPFETVVGGDNIYTSIAAASILAKTERDNYMRSLEGGNVYGWGSNKGYGTKQHITAIKEAGATEHHRDSFISHLLTTTSQLF
jgi:ribonuclease HII